MAAVALANGVNANLVRRWVLESDGLTDRGAPQLLDSIKRGTSTPATFVPLQLPTPAAAPTAPADIRIEVTRGATAIIVTWPVVAAPECAAVLRELLR
jgi:hypothetical protein